ncbi:hypothetical protein [Ectopseudomonas toyotomiensis]|uniref:Sulfotransferase family protein n=1 Tax=Ectopseudomonas toyotomiensis TaxID=554344 RepID=A0AA42LKG1_9GAMM|nr:hypothetical protein [Pseudomonas toyotomiensis]MBG0842096.1 hypothetical protein [Pseudomonas toyotomiensis]MDH0701118.1 hypothetical protein [Pseudomonas toyotomiensis]
MLQLIRDPVAVITASHKRYLQFNAFQEVARQFGQPVSDSEVPIRTPEQTYEWLRPRLFYDREGRRFANYFKEWKSIDAQSLLPTRVDAMMSSLYRYLGVDSEYRDPLFYKDFHGFLQRTLMFSNVDLDMYGYCLPVRLELARNESTLDRRRWQVLARQAFPIRDLGRGEAESIELLLVTPMQKWLGLPGKLATYLTSVGLSELVEVMDQHVIPRWFRGMTMAQEFIEQRWVRELNEQLLNRMKQELGDDLCRFCEHHPEMQPELHHFVS